jgi:hypothetical protein
MSLSVINVVAVVVIALAVLAGALLTGAVAVGISPPDILPYDWFESSLQAVADAGGGETAGIIAASAVVSLAMVAVLFFEVRGGRRRAFLIAASEAGSTTIEEASVRILAERTGVSLHGVLDAKCRVSENGGHLALACRVAIGVGGNAVEVGNELQAKVKEAIEQSTGLGVARVDVRVRYRPRESRRLAIRQ